MTKPHSVNEYAIDDISLIKMPKTQEISSAEDVGSWSLNKIVAPILFKLSKFAAVKDAIQPEAEAYIHKYIQEALYEKKDEKGKALLLNYFNDPELKWMSDRSVELFMEQVGKTGHQKEGVLGISKVTGYLIETIVDRIMLKKGIHSDIQRPNWKSKIMRPYHDCISKTKALQVAIQCGTDFLTVLPANLGIALVVEITHDKLGENLGRHEKAHIDSQIEEYKKCFKKNKNPELCAYQSIRKSVQVVVANELERGIQPHFKSPGGAERLKTVQTERINELGQCLETAKEAKDFIACIDELVVEAGQQTVEERVIHDPKVVKAVSEQAERESLSSLQQETFGNCAQEQIKNDQRKLDRQGAKSAVLNIDSCTDLVLANVIREVTLRVMKSSAIKNLRFEPSTPETPEQKQERKEKEIQESKEVLEMARAKLDSQWSSAKTPDQRNRAIRETIKKIAPLIAKRVIEKTAGSEYTAQHQKEIMDLVNPMAGCLERNLPIKLIEGEDTDPAIEFCVSALRAKAAKKIGTYQLQKQAEKYVPKEALHVFVEEHIQAFMKQLGPHPTQNDLNVSVVALKKKASKDIGKIKLPQELNKLFPEDYPPQKKEEFATRVLNDLNTCLDEKLLPEKSKEADANIDFCYKERVKQIALGMAEIQIQAKVSALYKNSTDLYTLLQDALLNEMKNCLKEHEAEKLETYIQSASVCGASLVDYAVLSFFQDLALSAVEKDLAFQPNLCANCLSASQSATLPGANINKQSEDVFQVMKVMLKDCVDYDVTSAKGDFEFVLQKISSELKAITPVKSREKLIDWLTHDTKIFEQMVKSIVLARVKNAFHHLSPDQQLPQKLVNELTKPETINKLFENPQAKLIIQQAAMEVLKPILMEGLSINDPKLKAVNQDLEMKVRDLLRVSPSFGGKIRDTKIQAAMNELPWYKKAMVKVMDFFTGRDILNWDRAKETEDGKVAVQYIDDQIMRPIFQNQNISDEELLERMVKARELVKKAALSKP